MSANKKDKYIKCNECGFRTNNKNKIRKHFSEIHKKIMPHYRDGSSYWWRTKTTMEEK